MPPRPKYPKPDKNQAQLCTDLEGLGLGFETYPAISRLPDVDCPGDVLVKGWHCGWHRAVWQPFELKTAKGALTPGQTERQHDVPIVRTVEDILLWYGYKEDKDD